jgi:hypothetical protein
MRRWLIAAGLALGLGAEAPAAAAPLASGTSTAATASSAADRAGVLLTEKRPVPNLDGRPEPSPGAGDVLIWVPRVLLSPVHLVFEWGVRKPLGALLTVAEREKWAEIVVDFLTFEDRKIGIVPTFFYDFNFRPSVGVYVFWNELFVKPHSVRFTAGYGGTDWYRVSFVDRWRLAEETRLELGFNLWGRPDYLFSGVGLEGDPDRRARFFREFREGLARVVARPWRGSEVRVEAGVRSNDFADGDLEDEGEVTLTQLVESGAASVPAGFRAGYTSSFQRVLVEIDSRRERPAPGSGVLLSSYLTHGWDIEDPDRFEWMSYGSRVGGFLDLGAQRVLGLSARAHFVNPVGDREVPFTELFVLGRRPQDLSAFLPGVLRGRSAAIATLEYNYPIWVFLDGSLQLSVGNAFGRNLEDFEPGALRTSLGLGLQSSRDRDNAFTLLVAIGSTRFDEPFAVDSFRLVAGTQTGF